MKKKQNKKNLFLTKLKKKAYIIPDTDLETTLQTRQYTADPNVPSPVNVQCFAGKLCSLRRPHSSSGLFHFIAFVHGGRSVSIHLKVGNAALQNTCNAADASTTFV